MASHSSLGMVDDPVTGELVCECPQRSLCRSPGKHPRGRWKDAAFLTSEKVELVFGDILTANLGVATGRGFGVVLDIDPRNEGWETLARLEEDHGPLPETLTAKTGSRGEHRVFKYPEGLAISSLPARQGYTQGIDPKSNGGLIVVEPSRHASGNAYRWSDLDTALADLPTWMLAEASPEGVVDFSAPSVRTGPIVPPDSEVRLTQNTGDKIRWGNPGGDQSSLILPELAVARPLGWQPAPEGLRRRPTRLMRQQPMRLGVLWSADLPHWRQHPWNRLPRRRGSSAADRLRSSIGPPIPHQRREQDLECRSSEAGGPPSA